MEIKELGIIMGKRRKDLSLTQEDLAEMAGVTSKTLYMLEHGKGNPSIDTLLKIMNVLGLEISVSVKKVEV